MTTKIAGRIGSAGAGIAAGPTVSIALAAVLFFLPALIIVRQQCVKEGYEISRLSSALEKRSLEYEKLSATVSAELRREILFDKAAKAGFVFPSGKRVFYVGR